MLEQTFLHQKAFALQLRKEPLDVRLEHLEILEQILIQHQTDFCEALFKDFKKPEAECLLTEIYPLIHEIEFVRRHLKSWMKPQKVGAPLILKASTNAIQYEPRGTCLLISPWNYPVYLTLGPLISAIAAGNTVVIKPSEISSHVSHLLAKVIKENFNEEHVTVIEGGVEQTQELLKLPFDHIFFTGSTRVGKVIMEAASKHLSSVTLELGGKSPTIVDSTANLELAASKILWGKFINAGQTCVAPDYLFVQESVFNHFLAILKEKLHTLYGEKNLNPDIARIINTDHTLRLKEMLEEALSLNSTVISGGRVDVAERFIEPTLITDVDPHARLMKEEIFGPILPIIKFKELSEIIHFINDRPKPLAMYVFSNSKLNIEQLSHETSSGALCFNDAVIHMANPHLPFGGVGESGMGGSHGIHGFKAFSHGKAIFKQSWLGKFLNIVHPPYSSKKVALMKQMIRFKI